MNPTDDLVPSIVNLERAFAHEPSNYVLQEKLHNLAAGHGLARPQLSLLEEAAGILPANVWWLLVGGLGFVFLVAVGAHLMQRRGAIVVAASAALLLLVSTTGAFANESRLARAVVIEPAVLRTAPTEHADALTSDRAVRPGDVLRTLDRHGGWTQVVTPNGARAWLSADALALVAGS